MPGQLIMIVGALIVCMVTTAIAVLLGVRARLPLAVDVLRRFSRLFNPMQMRTAGSRGAPTSVIRHVGRKSGRAYATPVDAVATEDGFLIALPYGTQSNWARNVLASGNATIVDDGNTYAVDRPEVIPLETVATRFSASTQRSLRLFGVVQCLRLRRIDAAEAA
jgi:deazaflavin-dependent oxidoreductase (nitroreductase family)